MCNNKQHQGWAKTYTTTKHKWVIESDVDLYFFGNGLEETFELIITWFRDAIWLAEHIFPYKE